MSFMPRRCAPRSRADGFDCGMLIRCEIVGLVATNMTTSALAMSRTPSGGPPNKRFAATLRLGESTVYEV